MLSLAILCENQSESELDFWDDDDEREIVALRLK